MLAANPVKPRKRLMDIMSLTYLNDMGFETLDEYLTLVASVKYQTPEQQKQFLEWRDSDGTKAGLTEILKTQSEPQTSA